MNVKGILISAMLVASTQVVAGNLLSLSNAPLLINNCPISTTNEPLDLALSNRGFFVVSNGHKKGIQFFTRYGKLLLNNDRYVITDDSHFLLAVDKKSDAKHLHKLQVSNKNLPPQATTHINFGANLFAYSNKDNDFEISSSAYDSLGGNHVVTVKLAKMEIGHWSAKVFVDNTERGEGTIDFQNNGKFSKQQGFERIQWPAEYGMHDLSIDFSACTQYGSPSALELLNADGYPMGSLSGLTVTPNGEIVYLYTNGQTKTSKYRIAVAMFTNPGYLERVNSHLYSPTEKSGQPMIHWVNGEQRVLSGVLEAEACLTQ